jgi:hypothetical protein
MFAGAEGDPAQFVVMADVPTQTYRTFIGIEEVRFLDSRTGFQLLHSLHGQFPCTPGYLGAVWTMASIGMDWSSS